MGHAPAPDTIVTAAKDCIGKRSKVGNDVGIFTAVNAIGRKASFV